MRRHMRVYMGVLLALIERQYLRLLAHIGQTLIRVGHKLAARWKDDDGWRHRFFLQCYLVDIEVHYQSGGVLRGPMYAFFPSTLKKRTLIAKLNWAAARSIGTDWKFGGATDLVFPVYRTLHVVSSGDAWFSFDGGHAVIFLGEPKERLRFAGNEDSCRVYTYF